MRRNVFLAISLLVVGCTARPSARIDDVAVPYPTNTGYRVISVDGVAETRASSSFITIVPLVIVESGTHTLGLKPPDGGPPVEITASIEADKNYRIALKDDKPTLVLNEP